ncbi:hypothetical protein EYF80_047356 [Liparis tanakae]|uniref:Uncharacterized protein n=1 Tax=Liparis tanakae TaxID=230148 RepID=A0A4Z2FNN8_9TELE|nr:hypothetical protein EYF80_047356 [Liparis tanakae]
MPTLSSKAVDWVHPPRGAISTGPHGSEQCGAAYHWTHSTWAMSDPGEQNLLSRLRALGELEERMEGGLRAKYYTNR